GREVGTVRWGCHRQQRPAPRGRSHAPERGRRMSGKVSRTRTVLPGSQSGEQPLWHRMSEAAGLISPTGEVQETIFGRMTALALSCDAVNLGQGAPGDPTPDFLVEAAHEAMRVGANQYPPPQGAPALREAIAQPRLRAWGHRVDAP